LKKTLGSSAAERKMNGERFEKRFLNLTCEARVGAYPAEAQKARNKVILIK
jgi:hypothetical protein